MHEDDIAKVFFICLSLSWITVLDLASCQAKLYHYNNNIFFQGFYYNNDIFFFKVTIIIMYLACLRRHLLIYLHIFNIFYMLFVKNEDDSFLF